MRSSFYRLPQELVENVFTHLPPDSLGRARCVCKSWNTLISGFVNDPEFVAKHLRNMENNPSPSFVFGGRLGREIPSFFNGSCRFYNIFTPLVKFPLVTLFDDRDADGSESRLHGGLEDVTLYDAEGSTNIDIKEVHHCHGILCSIPHRGTIMLCNPALKEYRRLPKSKIRARYNYFSGFGYDSRAKDYKVVRISSEGFTFRAEVYSLQTDSWREINLKNLGQIIPIPCKTLRWRGVCYWLVSDELPNGAAILCFDLCNEEFHIMPGPSDIDLFADGTGFFVWNDSLALFSRSVASAREASFELHVMENSSGVEGACSWTKCEDNVIPPKGILDAFTLWKKDELLMLDSNWRLVSYNLRSKILRDIHEVPPRQRWVCSYVKSLVSIRRR